jgi:RimJ/RimL family protein N-acetyltransferase
MSGIPVGSNMPGALVETGDRVTLRTSESEDVPFYQRTRANPELRIPIGNPVTSRDELDGVDGSDDDYFVVCVESDPPPGQPDDDLRRVGGVSVTGADWRRPELGYWIAPEDQGEGYGKEAVSLAVDYAFRTYDRPAVEAKVYDSNDASRGLLESLGFEEEGRLRRRRFIDGEYVDTVYYGLLRAEWDGPTDA